MSAYQTQATEIRDADCLTDALKEMKMRTGKNCNPQVHKEPQCLEGYQGDKRSQKAEIIIKRAEVGGASNDIGFKKNDKGTFDAIISDYDRSYYNETWLKKLSQTYATRKAKKIAKQYGMEFEGEKVLNNGHVKLQFRVVGNNSGL